jgi:hypothetical protein
VCPILHFYSQSLSFSCHSNGVCRPLCYASHDASRSNQLCYFLLCPFCKRMTCWPSQSSTQQLTMFWSIANSGAILGTKPLGIPCMPMSLAVSAKALAQGSPPAPRVWPVLPLSFTLTTMTFWQPRERKYAIPWLYVRSVQTRMTLTAHG